GCHDLSEGGLAVALAEMAFAGGVGADVTQLPKAESAVSEVALFAESPTRFIIEVRPEQLSSFEELFGGLPCERIGQTCKELRLRIAGPSGEWIIWQPLETLRQAWQKPLDW